MRKFKPFAAAILLCCILFSSVANAESLQKTIKATFNNIKITADGKTITPKDTKGNVVEPFISDGIVYLPIQAAADAAGYNAVWNEKTQTVRLEKKTLGFDDKSLSWSITPDEVLKKHKGSIISDKSEEDGLRTIRCKIKDTILTYTVYEIEYEFVNEKLYAVYYLLTKSETEGLNLFLELRGSLAAYYNKAFDEEYIYNSEKKRFEVLDLSKDISSYNTGTNYFSCALKSSSDTVSTILSYVSGGKMYSSLFITRTPSDNIKDNGQTEKAQYVITPTGIKYHYPTCGTVKTIKQYVTAEDAKKAGYDACSICKPK